MDINNSLGLKEIINLSQEDKETAWANISHVARTDLHCTLIPTSEKIIQLVTNQECSDQDIELLKKLKRNIGQLDTLRGESLNKSYKDNEKLKFITAINNFFRDEIQSLHPELQKFKKLTKSNDKIFNRYINAYDRHLYKYSILSELFNFNYNQDISQYMKDNNNSLLFTHTENQSTLGELIGGKVETFRGKHFFEIDYGEIISINFLDKGLSKELLSVRLLSIIDFGRENSKNTSIKKNGEKLIITYENQSIPNPYSKYQPFNMLYLFDKLINSGTKERSSLSMGDGYFEIILILDS